MKYYIEYNHNNTISVLSEVLDNGLRWENPKYIIKPLLMSLDVSLSYLHFVQNEYPNNPKYQHRYLKSYFKIKVHE